MRQSQRDKRDYLIIGLCAVVAIMAVGFAAFSQQLTINSTSEVTSSWCVGFDTSKTTDYVATPGLSGATTPTATMSYSGNTCGSDNLQTGASLSATFKQPGDQVVYTFTIKNASTLNAKLDSINENLTTSNSAIEYELSGAKANDILGPNDTTTLIVTVRYKDSITNQPEVTTWGLELKLNFSQTSDSPVPPVPTYTVNDLKANTVTTGDGLYDNGDGTYTYKGSNPANYLSFAGNIWRILGIDSTGIKIISNERIDLTGYSGVVGSNSLLGQFDGQGLRDSSSNGAGGTYCSQGSYGCNIWSRDYTPSGDYTNGSYTGTVLLDSELKTFLNGTYYTSTLNSNSNIIDGTYNVGPYNNESSYTWTGKVALLTAPEYRAAGGSSSYLKKSFNWWLLSPSASNAYSVFCVYSGGDITGNGAHYSSGVRPVLYLSSNITLSGSGTDSNNAFTIS